MDHFEPVEKRIKSIRGHRVMLDSDLATIYGVSTKALNQAVRRNPNRFPADFMFQLSKSEAATLRSQSVQRLDAEVIVAMDACFSGAGGKVRLGQRRAAARDEGGDRDGATEPDRIHRGLGRADH
ncbi:MAG: ORF6N domain-containing protein [Elusimicrobiota bacterium]